MQIGQISWNLKLIDDGFKAGLAGASRQMDHLKAGMERAQKGSALLAGGLALAGVGALAFGKASVSAYNESARREAELIQLHQKNTGATKEQTQSLFDLAGATQAKGVVEDDAIVAGMSQLATFKLSTQAIKDLTPAMADMVAKQKGVNATGEDFTTVGNLMGKVMEGNVGALKKYGVSFTDAQRAMLENGTETERSAVLAEVLAQNFGGVNEALRDTPEGKIAALKNTIGDLQEGLGKFILNALDPVVRLFERLAQEVTDAGGIMKYLEKLWKENETLIVQIATAISLALVPALVAMAASVWATLWPIGLLMVAGAALGLLIKKVADSMGGWGNLWDALKKTFVGVKDVVLSLGKTIKMIWDKYVYPSIQGWMTIFSALWKYVIKPVFGFIGKIIGWIIEKWNGLSDGVKDTIKKIAIVIGVLVAAFSAPVIAIGLLIGYIVRLWQTSEKFRDIVKGVWDAISGAVKWAWETVIKPIWDAISWYITDFLIPVFQKVWDTIKSVWDGIVTAFNIGKAIVVLVFDLIKGYIENVLIPVWTKIFDVVKSVWDGIWDAITTAWAWIKPIFQAIWDWIETNLLPIFKKIWDTVKTVFDKVKTGIGVAIDWIKEKFDKAKDFIKGLIETFTSIKDKIMGAFKNAKNWLKDIGKDIINGLVDGAKSILSKIGELFLKVVPEWIKTPFKKALGIKSPSKVFAGYGGDLVQGLAIGLSDSVPVTRAISGLSQMISGDMSTRLAGIGANSSAGLATQITSDVGQSSQMQSGVIIQNVNLEGVWTSSRADRRDLAKDFLDAVNDELASKGVAPLGGGAISGTGG